WCQLGRNGDLDLGVQIAGLTTWASQPAATKPQPAPRRRSRRNTHLGLAAGGLDRDSGAQRRLPRGEGKVHIEVAAVHAVAGMGSQPHDEIEVTGWATVDALTALPSQANALSLGHTRRDG